MTDESTRQFVREKISQVAAIQKTLIKESMLPNHDKIDALLRMDKVLETEYFASVLPKFDLDEPTKAFLKKIVIGDRIVELHKVMTEGQLFRDNHVKKGDGFGEDFRVKL